MNNKEFDSYIDNAVSQLPSEMSPGKDLWPGIEKAISQPYSEVPIKHSNWHRYSALAACFCLCLLGFQLFNQQQGPNLEQSLNNMNAVFQQEKQALLVQYQSQPAVTDNWRSQLADLEQAEDALKAALENEPENAALLRMLSQVYQQQLDLINKVHQPSWQRI